MISSTYLTTQPALQPQANRPVATIGRTVACDAYAPSARVQFGDNAAKPSLWERLKQGLKRLWQAVADPFKRLKAWIQKNWMQKKAESPASSGPEQSAAPSAAETNRVPKLTALIPPTEQQALTLHESGSKLNTSRLEDTNQLALPQTERDATSIPPERSALSSAQGVIVPQAEPHGFELVQIPAQASLLDAPTTPTSIEVPSSQSNPSATAETIPEHPTAPEAPPLPAPGTDETEGVVISPAQEASNNLQQDQAHQLRGDEALALRVAAEEYRLATEQSSLQHAQIQQDHALALQLQESAGGSQVMQVAPAASTTSPALMQELFGPDLTRIQFKQKDGNTCYLLSALDAIFHHPQGKQILAKIQITRTPDGYAVKFPGQPEAVDVKAQELVTGKKNLKLANGQQVDGVKSKCLGVRILECAYSKIPNPIFGQYDESKNAMTRIFDPDHEVINIQNSRNPEKGVLRNAAGQPIAVDYVDGVRIETLVPWEGDHRIGEFEFKHDERVEQFRQYIQHARNQDELDIITAKPFNQAHYYAVRAHQSTPQTIVLADPFNTGRTIQVKFDDFMKRYDIEGVRLPR